MVIRNSLFISLFLVGGWSVASEASLLESVKFGWGKFCEKYLIMPDYRETLKTDIVHKLTDQVADEDSRIERLVSHYRQLGRLRLSAADFLGKSGKGQVILAEDSLICGIMMTEIGNELRRIMLSHHDPFHDTRFAKIWDAMDEFLIFEGRWVAVKHESSPDYERMDVEDF